MKTFRKWNMKSIEDWGAYMSDDGKAFYRAFKNFLKRNFPEAEVIGFIPNHYDASGFLKFEDACIYVSHSIDRYRLRVDFNETGAMNGVLYRLTKNEHTYTGGYNNFSSINGLVDSVHELLERKRRGYEAA